MRREHAIHLLDAIELGPSLDLCRDAFPERRGTFLLDGGAFTFFGAEPVASFRAFRTEERTRCGALASGSDIDWYTWTVGGAGVAYDVSLTASGNADILMWKWSGSAWSQISNTTSTKIAATSSGAGQYVVAVRGSSAQTYALKLTK